MNIVLGGGERVIGNFLQNGEELDSSFEIGGFETFSFDVNVAGTFRVSVGEIDTSSNADPFLQVFDPKGNLLGTDSGNFDASLQFSTFETGTFVAVVSDAGNNQSMQFRIRVFTSPGNLQLIGGRDRILQSGDEVNASIPLGTFAVYPFEVFTGGTFRVSVGETDTSSNADPLVQIFDSNGNLLGTDTGNFDASLQFSTFETGTFVAVVSDAGNNQPMQFRIRAFTVPGNIQLIDERDRNLQNGEEIDSSIPLGTFAVYPFDVSVDGTFRVSVGEIGNSSNADPLLQIFDPNGNLLGTDSGISDASLQFSTFETGTFVAVVSEAGNNQALQFRVRVFATPGDIQLIDDRDSTLQNGESVISEIPLGTFSIFPFIVADPGAISVSVAETSGVIPAEPFLEVFDTNGVLVDSDDGTSDAFVQFTTLQTGQFTAVVSDFGNNEPLQFSIIATGISDSPPPILGDVNHDGIVDLLDIAPFVELLTTGGTQIEADINQDGTVNLLDVQPFVDLLNG